jgi:hypothetical protein
MKMRIGLAIGAALVLLNTFPPNARTTQLFDMHSNFWVNLNQTLLHEALLTKGAADRRLQSQAPLTDSSLSDAERRDWPGAIAR